MAKICFPCALSVFWVRSSYFVISLSPSQGCFPTCTFITLLFKIFEDFFFLLLLSISFFSRRRTSLWTSVSCCAVQLHLGKLCSLSHRWVPLWFSVQMLLAFGFQRNLCVHYLYLCLYLFMSVYPFSLCSRPSLSWKQCLVSSVRLLMGWEGEAGPWPRPIWKLWASF